MVFMSSELSKSELSLWEHSRAAGTTIGRESLPSYTLRPNSIRSPSGPLSSLSFLLLSGFLRDPPSPLFAAARQPQPVNHVSLHIRLPHQQALPPSAHRTPGVCCRRCTQYALLQSVVPRRPGLLNEYVRQLSYVWRPPRPPVLRSSFVVRLVRYSNADAEPHHHFCSRLQPVWSGAFTTTGFSLASPGAPSVVHRRITGSARPYSVIRYKFPPFSGIVTAPVPNGESIFATNYQNATYLTYLSHLNQNPQMYAQLGAIAREFNFPSTAGICLYMHVNEAGSIFAPRISEESWGILWGHLFEPNAPGPTGGLPISGRIEFDIGRFHNGTASPLLVDIRIVDVAKARWYHSWMSVSRRETGSLPSLSPTHVASMHQRQESKTTEDTQEQSQTVTAPKKRSRYAPKRLSLVERFDLGSSPPMVSPVPMPAPVTTSVSMPEPHPASPPLAKTLVSSPIAQGDEPLKPHRVEIDTRVNSWRASSTFKTNLLASTGQVSLDPANMPNTLPLDPVDDEEVRSEMNPEDYSWSVTSAGPPSVLDSPTPSYRVPSVHMDRRAIGSVPLTPQTCTSWGPEDYDPHSPVSSVFRLPSPDLGQRYLEYCPMTPTTATSWGPPSEYPPSPNPESQEVHYYRAPSLDLGQRAGWSRPVTPSTATSWGPPSEYPPSPPLEPQWVYYRPPSVDLGRRAEGSRPVTPSTATSWGAPEEWPPTPTTLSRVSTPDAAQQMFSFAEEIGGLVPPPAMTTSTTPVPWSFVWPYLPHSEQKSKPLEQTPWNFVWPYLTGDEQRSKPLEQTPWNYVWPYLTPATQKLERTPWKYVWPYLTLDIQELEQTPWNYVWPYLTLNKQKLEQTPWNYVWPYLVRNVPTSHRLEFRGVSAVLERVAYPVFKICV